MIIINSHSKRNFSNLNFVLHKLYFNIFITREHYFKLFITYMRVTLYTVYYYP